MTATSLLTLTAIALHVLPVMCHRLITNPYPEAEWDSVIVSSDPITIREKKHNETTPSKATQILRPQKRSYEECPENDFSCLYGNNEGSKASNQIVDKFLEQYSNIAEVKFNEGKNLTEEEENENSRKSYWTMIDSQTHHHPYDDNKGWVTLDPVPWSTSKISKWLPNKGGVHQEIKPWGYGSTTQRPVQQFWVSGSSFHSQRPSSQWGLGTNDIITDNKPSDFPTAHYNGYGNPNQGSNYHPENGHHGYPGNYQDHPQNPTPQDFQGNYPPKIQQTGHPSTYPESGNGEWILLSTTKGYSIPQRHRWAGQKDDRFFSSRKIKPIEISRYHEEDLNGFTKSVKNPKGTRKSDVKADRDTVKNITDTSEKTPIQVLYTGSHSNSDEPVKTVRRKVRLQVLPALENTSTSYNGLLEVDSSQQTVDEAQQEDEKMQQLKAIANVKKNKIRGYKLVPTSKLTGKKMSHKSMMTLAAVGAGMIPATMALLVPMALGRKRRSSSDNYLGYDRIDDRGEIKELKNY